MSSQILIGDAWTVTQSKIQTMLMPMCSMLSKQFGARRMHLTRLKSAALQSQDE